ncbi:hypothetical protein WN55_07436 [Dufourea novaeangliae]|uniref:Uncharacterized protein n=1 Tax=Dufourea novaeangliae TaxID=178035 RepID=A0A154P2E5_DUFNO|nr:hypothetical protein WN55_07436 [Dufourea novaeangliae]
MPIHHPDAQDLKSSVSQGDSGLPPPQLPQYEPFHNEQQHSPKKEEHENVVTGQVNLQYEVQNVEPLSIVKTVGFELLPTTSPLTSDLHAGSLPTLKLPIVDSGGQLNVQSGGFRGFQKFRNDLSLSQVNTPSGNYGLPFQDASFGKLNSVESGLPIPPPPLHDTYSAPPRSSYSLNGPYPAAEAESIPSGLFTNLNRYSPPPRHHGITKSTKSYISPFSFEQQLPSLSAPITFNKLPAIDLGSPIAAPNAQYGTPLSFGDFNTPAPVLTYGAPNFGPASSFVSTSTGFGKNLYDSISNTITTTYGTPIVNAPQSTGVGHDCSFQQTSGTQYNLPDTRVHATDFGSQFESEFDSALSSDHSQAAEVANVLVAPSVIQSHDVASSTSHFHQDGGIRADALTASLARKGYGQSKNLDSSGVDASQFFNTHEGSEALSLAKGLTTANGADGFEIQGSKGTYMLQIQPADGGLGTENSDGSIRHDHVLSNGLLQDILAAIEQPDQGQVQLQGFPEAQPLQHVYSDLPQTVNDDVSKGHYITVEDSREKTNAEDLQLIGHASDRDEQQFNEADSTKKDTVALFFNNQFGDSRKETRSVAKSETVGTASSKDSKNYSAEKSS